MEFYRELASKSEEIGRLKALLEVRDQAIVGLQAMLGMKSFAVPPVQTVTSAFPSVGHTCNCGKHKVKTDGAELSVAKAETALDNLNEAISEVNEKTTPVESPRRGRPKGSGKKSTEPSGEATTEISSGGSVFREFEPLCSGNIASTNSSAYMPPEKPSVLTIL